MYVDKIGYIIFNNSTGTPKAICVWKAVEMFHRMNFVKSLMLTSFCVICVITTSSPSPPPTNPTSFEGWSLEDKRLYLRMLMSLRCSLPVRMKGFAAPQNAASNEKNSYDFVMDLDQQKAALVRRDGKAFKVYDYKHKQRHEQNDGDPICFTYSMRSNLSLPLVDPSRDERKWTYPIGATTQNYKKQGIGKLYVRRSISHGDTCLPIMGTLFTPKTKFSTDFVYRDVTASVNSTEVASLFPDVSKCVIYILG